MNRPLLLALLGIVAIGLSVGLNFITWKKDSEPDTPVTGQTSPSEQAATVTPASAPATGEVGPTLKPRSPDSSEAASPSDAPSFDVVRVNPKGDAVMAGRAKPGAKVILKDADEVIGEVVADPHGEWVFVPEKPLAPGSRELTLEMEVDGGPPVQSDTAVVLIVPEKGKDIAGRATQSEGQELPLAVIVDRRGGGTRVMQKPQADLDARHRDGMLSVESVDYDDAGHLTISGRAEPGSTVQLYLDNMFIGRAIADDGGTWRVTPDGVLPPGLYTLRADQVGKDGKVAARVAFPFSRADTVAAALEPGTFVVVQPGNSLWRIARRTYGQGISYTVIFDANKDQIVDPDLIYPGQIFALPDEG